MAHVHIIMLPHIPATSSCFLVGAFLLAGVMADTMLIVHLCRLTITDVLPSIMCHDALFSNSYNACVR